MVSKQIPGARLVLAGGAAALLAACSSLHSARRPAASVAPPSAPLAARAFSPGNLTATQAAIAAAGQGTTAPASARVEAASALIRSSAPMTYTVKPGDTLWGIASMFLRDPWDWPEVWYNNPKIKNPHWIYPGDVLQLAYGRNGRARIRLLRASPLRRASTLTLKPRLLSTPLSAAIPTIPYAAIASFLARPTVLTSAQVRRAPHIIAFRNQQQIGGSGSVAYVSSLGRHPLARYSVVHVGEELRDPGLFGHTFGYLGTYTATALIRAPGDPATVVLTDAARETFAGDRLISSDAGIPLTFEPRAPSRPIHGKVIWVIGGTGAMDLAGQYDIVVLNRGTRAGLVPGDVLTADHEQGTVHDTHGSFSWLFRSFGGLGRDFAPRVKLPAERAATLLVFKAYRHLSFALVVAATNTITEGDPVHNP
jgi:hypothetical protein